MLYSERIKAIRSHLDISISKMAKQMNMSESTLKSYIRGDRTASLDFLLKLHNVYNVNANWFITGCGEMFNSKSNSDPDTSKIRAIIDDTLKSYGLIK